MSVAVSTQRLRRLVARHRHLFAAGFAALAVASALSAVAPRHPALEPVVVAARDLPSGATLAASDLRTVGLPASTVPDGALTTSDDAVRHVLSGAVRRGEPLTDRRLLGRNILSNAATGSVASTVHVADADTLSLLQPGDRVDVLAAGDNAPAAAITIATDVPVLSIGRSDDGGYVVVASTPATASLLAAAATRDRLSLTLHAR